ncbi:hypothetical protein EYF80_007560 [Liparis tanakae]|uniref:Uncharacterized protein n=1 Tax=Liparis tanakae TaxID=230148 RepID=A0A4Z2IY12_9TELE|nr:hypothetical protein EYF80_007560 [Liparis tanakae]
MPSYFRPYTCLPSGGRKPLQVQRCSRREFTLLSAPAFGDLSGDHPERYNKCHAAEVNDDNNKPPALQLKDLHMDRLDKKPLLLKNVYVALGLLDM